MYHFTYWLEHFKELPPAKAQTITTTISNLSEKTAVVCSAVTRLSDCDTVSAFVHTRQAISRGYTNMTTAEKRALNLFGEFLEYKQYSKFKFPEEPTPKLAEYCKTMHMAYSYKAVLIHELVSCATSGISTDDLVSKMIAFYRDRIDRGQVAEKEDSVFSKPDVSFSAARKVVLSNPVQVLVNDQIIVWNKRTGVISFSSEYLPNSDTLRNEIQLICKDRLKKYYSSIKPKKSNGVNAQGDSNKKVKALLKRLETEIQNTTDKAAKKRLMTIYSSLCKELGFSTKQKAKAKKQTKKKVVSSLPTNEYAPLSFDDERKIGALVQESLAILEKIEFKFTRKQLDNLLSHEWSNTTMKLNYPFLKLLDESKPIAEQRVDHLGNGRYYSSAYTFNGKKYLVTSQWYAKSKPAYITWYNQLKPQKKK